jgi:hypothetical protein
MSIKARSRIALIFRNLLGERSQSAENGWADCLLLVLSGRNPTRSERGWPEMHEAGAEEP